ncbi:MAG: hypothetical protein Q4A71_07135 [Actinomycetaceae bacterium]|nr:hypothetical protein [Actinomycetaceae bacterium]
MPRKLLVLSAVSVSLALLGGCGALTHQGSTAPSPSISDSAKKKPAPNHGHNMNKVAIVGFEEKSEAVKALKSADNVTLNTLPESVRTALEKAAKESTASIEAVQGLSDTTVSVELSPALDEDKFGNFLHQVESIDSVNYAEGDQQATPKK